MQANQSSSSAFDVRRPPGTSLGEAFQAEEQVGSSLLTPGRLDAFYFSRSIEVDEERALPELLTLPELFTLPELVPFPGLAPLHLLVIEAGDVIRQTCCEIAASMGFAVTAAKDLHEARAILEHLRVDVVLLDPRSSEDGLQVLAELKALSAEALLLVVTACASVTGAVEAMRAGAGDYLTSPFTRSELALMLRRALERPGPSAERRRLREKLRNGASAGHFAGSSPEMEKVYRMVSKVTHTAHPVLIRGEGGTGKELVARAIHFHGPGAHRPFVPVDCGSLMPSLMEGELFGYVKGAFPGAVRGKAGLLTSVQGGTVFLDGVSELPVDLQSKLLRGLEDKVVRPVGGTQYVPLVARVLAATDKDLMAMVEGGRFRRDLYFRLNVVTLRIPPLRERREDIVELAQYFLERHGRENGRAYRLTEDALTLVSAYGWPGNVRELEAIIEQACTLSSGPLIHAGDLPAALQAQRREGQEVHVAETVLVGKHGRQGRIVSLAEVERNTICRTLQQLQGDKLQAAKLLGIGKTTLYRKLKEYGIPESN